MIDQIVAEVLESIDAEGRTKLGHASTWERAVADAIAKLESSYPDLWKADRQPIDYGHRATQAAYVYRYLYGHAEFNAEFLTLARAHLRKPLFSPGEIRVVSLGGGPGSELLGLIKYLTGSPGEAHVTKVHYTVIDKEPNWEHVATAVAHKASRFLPIDLKFGIFDVEDATGSRPILSNAHLVIASFFISEITQVPQRQTARDNVAALLRSMKPGALLLYKDSKAPPFLDRLREIIRQAGILTEIYEADQQFSVSTTPPHRIVQQYAARFSYGLKLNGKTVSKLYRRG